MYKIFAAVGVLIACLVVADAGECKTGICKMFCANGFEKDSMGCEICKCRPCSPVTCRMMCQHGFKTDKNGCEVCKCKCQFEGWFKMVVSGGCSRKFCPNGFKQDHNGCFMCSCIEKKSDD